MAIAFEPGHRYRAPSFVVVGWVPAIGWREPLPEAFRTHKHWWAHRLLFKTGNRTPPALFRNERTLSTFARTKDYRALLGVSGVEVGFDIKGRAVGETHDGLMQAGYTPLGVDVGGQTLGASFRIYSSGEQRMASSIAIGDDHAPISKSLDFRIGKWGNRAAKLLTGHWAPYAWVDFGYRIWADGHYEFRVSSTFIPSLTLYQDLRAVEHYQMDDLTAEQLEDFLTAETRQSSPQTGERFVRTGVLTAV